MKKLALIRRYAISTCVNKLPFQKPFKNSIKERKKTEKILQGYLLINPYPSCSTCNHFPFFNLLFSLFSASKNLSVKDAFFDVEGNGIEKKKFKHNNNQNTVLFQRVI